MRSTFIFAKHTLLVSTLGASLLALQTGGASAQTASVDLSRRLAAEEAKNIALTKENAALRARLKAAEEVKSRSSARAANQSQKTAPRREASAATSDQPPPATSSIAPAPVREFVAPADNWFGCTFEAPKPCAHGWIGIDYLVFNANSQTLPANLVTFGGASVLGTDQSVGNQSGIRVDAGLWALNQNIGLQFLGDFIFTGRTSTPFPVGSLLNTNGGANSFTTTGPSSFSASSAFNNVEANLMFRAVNLDDGLFQVYALTGPKLMTLSETDTFNYTLGAAGVPSANFLDQFGASNIFLGGQVGLMLKSDLGTYIPVSVDVAGKYVLGHNQVTATVLGSNNAAIAVPGTGGAAIGANTQVYTNDANIGSHTGVFNSSAYEFNANLRFQLASSFQLVVGYTFLQWDQAVRPGNQINPTLAPVAGVGGVHTAPTFPFATTSYIIQGANIGGTWTF